MENDTFRNGETNSAIELRKAIQKLQATIQIARNATCAMSDEKRRALRKKRKKKK